MADTNKEKDGKKKPIYKYGEHELDLGNYIHNLGTNLNSYLDTVKKNWSEGQKEEFTTAFDRYLNGLKEQMNTGVERFSTNNYGRITDLKGELSNVDDDGIDPSGSEYYYNNKGERITTDDYNRLKKRKQRDYKSFSANKEVAAYFKLIGEKIKNKQPKIADTATNYFDFNKHGFIKHFMDKYNPTGGEFDRNTILALDPFDETTGKRGTEKRIALFGSEIDEHLNKLDPTIDWSKTQWGNADEYKKYMQGVKQGLSDGLTEQDYLDYGRGGITRSFLETFNHTGKEFLTPQGEAAADAQKKAEEEAAKRKEQEDKYKAMMQERLNVFNSNRGEWNEHNPYAMGSLSFWNPTTGFDHDAFAESFNYKEQPQYFDKEGKFTGYTKYLNDYLTGDKIFSPEGQRAISALVGMGRYETVDDGPYKGMFYIPQQSDRTTNRALIYNPTSGEAMHVFIGDIPSQRRRITEAWKESEGITNKVDQYKLFKEGGSIEMMQLGGGFDADAWMQQAQEKSLKERATKEGRTMEQQKAGERKTNSDAKSAGSPDAEWKATDTARVAASIADIGSMISSFLPGAGTVIGAGLGIGSSLTTFGADWAEDGLDWGDVKNLGANLGLDVLGLIPAGGAASKGVKIAKTLGKYASRAMATVAAYQGLSNADNIIQSINKMTTDPTNLTVDDWRNISQGFGLLTGGVAASTRKVKKSIAEADMKAKANGAVAIEIVDKNNPANKKIVAFDGNDAAAIKKAQQSGNLDDLRKATVGKYEQFKDWDLATTGNTGLRPVRANGEWQLPWGAKEGRARIFDMYGDKNGNLYTKGGNWQADVKTGQPIDSATELQTATVDKAVADHKKAIMNELMEISARKKKHVEGLEGKIKKDNESITQKKSDLQAADDAGDIAKHRQLTTEIQATTDRRNRMSKLLQEIKQGKSKSYDSWKTKYLQGTGNDAKVVITSNPYNRPDYEVAFSQILKDLNLGKPNYFKYERGGRFNNVRRFLGGGDLRDVVNPGNWYSHMFNTPEMKKWLDTFNANDLNSIKQFNDLQDSWAVNKKNTGYNGQYAIKDKTGGVGTRQKQWNDITGTNPVFERIKGLTRHGGSTDNPEGGYVDNVFGSQENFRHGGTKESWANNQEQLQATIKAFADKGLDYYLDSNGMYKLRVKETAPDKTSPGVETAPPVIETGNEKYTDAAGGGDSEETGNTKSRKESLLGGAMKGFLRDPSNTYGLARMALTDAFNKKTTQHMIDAEIPTYIDAPEHQDYVPYTLDIENAAHQFKAEMNSKASRPLTSDGSLQTAAMLESQKIGLEGEQKKMAEASAIHREAQLLNNQHDYEDATKKINAANINRAAGNATYANIKKHLATESNQKGANYIKGLQEREYYARQKMNDPEQLAQIRSDIHNTALELAVNDGEALGLTPEQVEIYKMLKEGKSVNDLSPEQQQALRVGNNILSQYEQNEWAKYRGLRRFDHARQYAQNQEEPDFFTYSDGSYVREAKNGAKLAIAGIKARTADAERFQKMIIESMKRNDRALDRIAKSMVNYVKDIMK